jgi:hypothetical protein
VSDNVATLMAEDGNEPQKLLVEELIALLQQYPGWIVEVGAYGGMGALIVSKEDVE